MPTLPYAAYLARQNDSIYEKLNNLKKSCKIIFIKVVEWDLSYFVTEMEVLKSQSLYNLLAPVLRSLTQLQCLLDKP